MSSIVLISKCIESGENHSLFHFVGFYNGIKVTSIITDGNNFEVNTDYVISLKNITQLKKTSQIIGEITKIKELFT